MKTRLKVDNLGRITLPVQVRKALGLQKGKYCEILWEEDKVIIPKNEVPDIDMDIKNLMLAAENSTKLTKDEVDILIDIVSTLRAEVGGMNIRTKRC